MIRLAFLLLLLATPALAESMSFYFDNQKRFDVAVELYGERRGRVWPGNGQVYLIEKEMRKSLPVECRAGERICYGGWRLGDDRVTFGAGPDKAFACTDCCFICVDKSTATVRFTD